MKQKLSQIPYWIYGVVCAAAILICTLLIPAEQTLGKGIRLIYFHGVWVWTGIILYCLAGVFGLFAVAFRRGNLHDLSRSISRTALFYWLTYLPMAMLVMKLNWNGFYFMEPRWAIPFSLTLTSLLVQIGTMLINQPVVTSLSNLGFTVILIYNLRRLQSVLHPESPVQQSGSASIQISFYVLLFFTFLFGLWLTWGIQIWTQRKKAVKTK
jgi:hypothetical protein